MNDPQPTSLVSRSEFLLVAQTACPAPERCDGLRDGGAAFTSEHVDQARELAALAHRVRRRLS